MSSQNPSNPSRRRRIAGERRPATTSSVAPAPPAAERVEPASRPVERTSESVKPDETRRATSGSRPIPGVVLIVLGLLAAVAVGLAAYFWTQSSEAEAAAEAQTRAPAAAERAALAVLSYNFESLEADKAKAARFLTDGYRPKYVDTFDTLVTKNATDLRAEVEAQVVASSVTRATPERADVLLFVNQTTTSTASEGEPQTALNRVMLEMREVDGTWLVNGITSY